MTQPLETSRPDGAVARDRVFTVPNLISFARLLGVPLFLYLFLVADRIGWAVVVLALGGTTDWIDGYLARRLGQVSRLGELLDPFADRLYILATLLAFTLRDIVPWQFTVALLARDVLLVLTFPVLRRLGYGPLPVHYLGKTATFILLMGFPILLLAWAVPTGALHDIAYASGWALAWWGIVLYWIAGIFYLAQFAAVLRQSRQAAA
ncbi:CDP-alcohol phosphatidyltransferase family protein [Catellatospora tritici]|uniref:CDP-alcohol phosphatidyltransferase family protein n=1 Tax=Catellatospora tritici TaxID=2851566 RepID=UPI001C2D447A|nr:CDP-alcohol phosphatidyltransferase family protein [Catellatospora tritici]MBV1852991.1 CDP-alcohol phosphatidyltransferase family protein [Catellatospora tritici]